MSGIYTKAVGKKRNSYWKAIINQEVILFIVPAIFGNKAHYAMMGKFIIQFFFLYRLNKRILLFIKKFSWSQKRRKIMRDQVSFLHNIDFMLEYWNDKFSLQTQFKNNCF